MSLYQSNNIEKEYFEWMSDIVCGDRYPSNISYNKLLDRLNNIEFTFTITRDSNRAQDGVDLRYRFTSSNCYDDYDCDYLNYIKGPCSVLEMMVSLAIRCEESIMDDPKLGNRTSQWFWGMVTNLGLGAMYDNRFDEEYVDDIIERFLNHDYGRDGRGGLFTIHDSTHDMRKAEIWYQLNWYLDTIT